LIGEVLIRRRHSNPRVAFLIERRVISASTKAVVAKDQIDTQLGKVALADSPHVTRDLSRSGIVWLFGKNEHAAIVDYAVARHFAADDVVVQNGLDGLRFLFQAFRHRASTDQSLLFAGERHK